MLKRSGQTALLPVLGMIWFAVGCTGNNASAPVDSQDAGATPVAQTGSHDEHQGHQDESEAGKHSGWWCVEHGVPEGECTRCDASLTASFKEKGDWCDEHDLPESQCFKCDPSRAEPFIARYEAKYGKKPPAPTE